MAYERALFGRPGSITSDHYTQGVAKEQPLMNLGYSKALGQLRDMPVSSDTIYGEQILGKAKAEQDLLADMAFQSAGLRNRASLQNMQAALAQAQNRRTSERALMSSVANLRGNALASLSQLAPDIVTSIGQADRRWREEHDGQGLLEALKMAEAEMQAAPPPVKSGLDRLRGAYETQRKDEPPGTGEIAKAAMERRSQTPEGQRTDVTREEFEALQDMQELEDVLARKDAYERGILGAGASQVDSIEGDLYTAPSQYSVMIKDAEGKSVESPISMGEVAAVERARMRAEGLSGDARIARMSEDLKDLGYSIDEVIAADNAIPRRESGPLFGEIPERELMGGWSEVRPARRPSTSGPRPYEGALIRAAGQGPKASWDPNSGMSESQVKDRLMEQILRNWQGFRGSNGD